MIGDPQRLARCSTSAYTQNYDQHAEQLHHECPWGAQYLVGAEPAQVANEPVWGGSQEVRCRRRWRARRCGRLWTAPRLQPSAVGFVVRGPLVLMTKLSPSRLSWRILPPQPKRKTAHKQRSNKAARNCSRPALTSRGRPHLSRAALCTFPPFVLTPTPSAVRGPASGSHHRAPTGPDRTPHPCCHHAHEPCGRAPAQPVATHHAQRQINSRRHSLL